MEMLPVCVYKDTTGMYTESECDIDNLVDLEFPEEIIREYYNANRGRFVLDTINELHLTNKECDFETWYHEVYTADDTINLMTFAAKRGYMPKRPDGKEILEQVEVCPYCESENHFINWDPDYLGFVATCKTCGKKMFLCDACLNADDNENSKCDWHEDEYGRGCFRGFIKKGE